MSRPIVGVVRIQKEQRKRANGDTYVYEREVIYDTNTHRNKTLKRKLLGVIKKGMDTMTETRERLNNTVKVQSQDNNGNTVISRKKIGLMSILDWCGKSSDIDDDLYAAFGDNTILANRCINIARFWVGTDGLSLPNLKNWQIKHGLDDVNLISEDMYHDVFDEIGRHEDFSQNFFKCRANSFNKGNILAIDCTTTSTYSQQLLQESARYGFNKDGDSLPTIKTLTFYSLDSSQPLAFYQQPGNIPDVISVKNAIKELDYLNLSEPLVVTDNGFVSNDNICSFLLEHIRFLMRVTTRDGVWLKKLINAHLDDLELLDNQLLFDPDLRGVTVCATHNFSYTCKYNTEKHKANEQVTFSRRLYLHIYRSIDKTNDETRAFDSELHSLKSHLLNNEELNDPAQKQAEKYFKITEHRNGKITVTTKQDVYLEHKKNLGLIILLSNRIKDKEMAIQTYRKREHIEDHFEALKEHTNGLKPRVWDDWRFRGRQFVQFVALCYYDFLYKKITDLKNSLAVPNGDKIHDTQSNLKVEKKLKNWLSNKSLHEILDWFDCVEMVSLCGTKHPKIRMVTEQIGRDTLFLTKIGYTGLLRA